MIEWWEPHAEALQTAGVFVRIRNGCPRIWATLLPVVNADGTLVGIIRRSAILRYVFSVMFVKEE